ncbi:MAG: hypothetical protein DWG76_01755 [Chloroflexi bacterium]|nr:hypothetical protein [Chloroflexota bacterium]MQC26158.1 hypothetical protein [Chloroflexota bacterium]
MGHTLPTITGHFDRFLTHLSAFRRALRRSDQLSLDTLLGEAKQHTPAASYAANVVPGVTFLLCLLLEKHKQMERHEVEFENLRREFRLELEKVRGEFELLRAKERTKYFLKGIEVGHQQNP